MSIVHTDEKILSAIIGQQEQTGGAVNALTTTNIGASSTVAALDAAVLAARLHADEFPLQNNVVNALDLGAGTTDVPSNPSTATNVAGLVALTQLDVNLRPSTGPLLLD